MLSLHNRSTNASLPNGGGSLWGKIRGGGKNKEAEAREKQALARQRLLTLAFDDMETVRMVCSVISPRSLSNRAAAAAQHVCSTAFLELASITDMVPRNSKPSLAIGPNHLQMQCLLSAFLSSSRHSMPPSVLSLLIPLIDN